MASEEVIELGSSDDEAEPAAKKMKPRPNAMVHIPTKIHGVTIKPTDTSGPVIPVLGRKSITGTKINNVPSSGANKMKPKGKQIQRQNVRIEVQKASPKFHAVKQNINPMNIIKRLNSQVMVSKIPSHPKILHPVKVVNVPKKLNYNNVLVKAQSLKPLSSLPPSITIKRTSTLLQNKAPKRPAVTNVLNARKVQKITANQQIPNSNDVDTVLTVELDDDEVPQASTSSPQWYLRPEEINSEPKIDLGHQDINIEVDPLCEEPQESNNKEPDPTKFIEITIQDSPMKTVKKKKAHEKGVDLAITIEDSPVKPVGKPKSPIGSEDENTENTAVVPHSKKKLEYPKEAQTTMRTDTIEIEIEPMSPNEEIDSESLTKNTDVLEDVVSDSVIEIEESPLKPLETLQTSTPKKADKKKVKELKMNEPVLRVGADGNGEFHNVYQTFINLCFQLEDSEDMKKIVDKKIKAYYKQVPKEYTESEDFIDMVSSKIISMKANPEKMYLYIKDIVDELNLQRKMAKTQPLVAESNNTERDQFLYGEDSEFDSKRQRQIRKLEKTLKNLHRAIQKLEEQEVDFEDEEDSVYLLTESDSGSSSSTDIDRQLEKNRKELLKRYKERMLRVHAKFCQLTNTKLPSEPRVQIDARPGQPSGPAKRLEKWINKKVPIGTPLPFPDFHDVIRCVRDANEEDKLGWNEVDIMEEARDLFVRCGKKLQRRRQENDWRLAASRMTVDVDPAEESADLKRKLELNKQVATKKETEVFNKYADRQNQLKLEGEEIGDKEAEESPVESEDEEPKESSTLGNKEKRKERLRRLIQEKSKRTAEEKQSEQIVLEENQSGNTLTDDTQEGDKETLKKETNTNEVLSKESKIKGDKVTPNNEKDGIELKDDGNSRKDGRSENAMEVDPVSSDDNLKENKKDTNTIEKVHSISDDSNMLASDVDELHLLQKLHSENENNTSTLDSSDNDSPIDISDTLQSSSDSKGKSTAGVIENSSYSESEDVKEIKDFQENETDQTVNKITVTPARDHCEVDKCQSSPEKKTTQTNNDEYNDSVENILLASSDDEACETKDNPEIDVVNSKDNKVIVPEVDLNKDNIPENNDTCQLKCDSTSRGEVLPQEIDLNGDSSPDTDDITICINLKDDSISLPEAPVLDNDNTEGSDETGDTCTNFRDTLSNDSSVTCVDTLSIGETGFQGVDLYNDSSPGTDDACVFLKEDSASLDETVFRNKESSIEGDGTDSQKEIETSSKGISPRINKINEDVAPTKNSKEVTIVTKTNNTDSANNIDTSQSLNNVEIMEQESEMTEITKRPLNVQLEDTEKVIAPSNNNVPLHSEENDPIMSS